MPPLRVHYLVSPGIGYERVAGANVDALVDQGVEVVPTIDAAQVVILHAPPSYNRALLERHPVLGDKYLIGCCYWEASPIPDAFRAGLPLVDEVWTPSRYGAELFRPHHPRVQVVPHIVARPSAPSTKTRARMRREICHEPGKTYFLTVARLLDPRENVDQLVEALRAVHDRMPDVRLVVKSVAGRSEQEEEIETRIAAYGLDEGPVVLVRRHLSEEEMTALYELADLFVSAHHSECWGLTLTEAMALGVPTLATRYSGNLEFMTDENSVLVDAEEDFIAPEDCFYLFTPGMRWGYPRGGDLKSKLVASRELLRDGTLARRAARGMRDLERFAPERVGALMRSRLHDAVALAAR